MSDILGAEVSVLLNGLELLVKPKDLGRGRRKWALVDIDFDELFGR